MGNVLGGQTLVAALRERRQRCHVWRGGGGGVGAGGQPDVSPRGACMPGNTWLTGGWGSPSGEA
eukprot:8607906-Alexandrium_andersonii.AAC.1